MEPRKSSRNLNNSSSRQINNTLNLVDRISALPDSILGFILSYLPTKNVVATTILSKRWKFVWMSVHNLDFCFLEDWEGNDKYMIFTRFVDRILLIPDGGLLIKFRLVLSPRFIPSQVSTWINTAISRNLHDLFVSVYPYVRYSMSESLEMPISVFTSDSLKSLELNGRISVPETIVVRLPKLESLKLDSIYFQSKEAFENLISGCPLLNFLQLHVDGSKRGLYCRDKVKFSYIISSTSLRHLEIRVFWYTPSLKLEASSIEVCLPRLESLKLDSVYFQSEKDFVKLISGCPKINYLQLNVYGNKKGLYSRNNVEFTYIISSTSLRRLEVRVESDSWYTPSLKLETYSLEYLKLDGFIPKVFVKGTLSCLVEADFRFRFYETVLCKDTCNSVVELIRAFDCVKDLTLSMGAMWAISNATISLSTKFRNLTKLAARATTCYCRSLQDFIQSSDNLEVLTVEQDFGSLKEKSVDRSKWIAPVEVPRCLSNSLKEVSFKGFAGLNDERQMIGYMLKHGSALEVVKVYCYPRRRKVLKLIKEICSLPRTSTCKVECLE